jgi:curved DNA-binding protein CbpA
MDQNKDYYAILGVLPTAEDIVIRAAYRALAQRYHPDRYEGSSEEAHEKMAEINEAYGVLSNPESRKEYDNLRGEMAHDASSFFDESKNSNGTFYDPLSEEWEIASEFYPDLLGLEKSLSKVSYKLAFTFKAVMLDTKNFENRVEIAASLEQEFLKLYFGENVVVLGFARSLIERGEKQAAKSLNAALRVLGPNSDPNLVINRITDKYHLTFRGEQQKLIEAVWDGNWSSAKELLENGVNPVGLRNTQGITITELARKRGDKQMLNLLAAYGAK